MIIQNLYKTIITVYSDSDYTNESYLINIDGTAYIKITLLDFNNRPVIAEEVEISYDNNIITTDTTNINGEIKTSVSCNKWGIHRISANDTVENIQVKGYKNYYTGTSNGAYIIIDYNEELVRIYVEGSIPVTTSWKVLYTIAEQSLRPLQPVNQIIYWGNTLVLSVSDSTGQILFKDIKGSWTPGISQEICYARRNLDFTEY